MRLWLVLPYLPTGTLAPLAVEAEQLGVTGVAIGDHVCVPRGVSSIYPYSGKVADLPAGTEFPDPLVLAAGLGCATSRLRFMTYVYLLPLRHPVSTARAAATASVLLQGRLDFGVGVGWLREEFQALGVPFDERGARMDESLDVLTRLWSGEVVEHHGRHYPFGRLSIHPAPPKPIPVFVGGHSVAALRRAARHGAGWVAVNPTIDDLEAIVPRLGEELAAAGRTPDGFELRTGLRGRLTTERVQSARRLGVTDLMVMPWQLAEASCAPRIYESTADQVAAALPSFIHRIGEALADA